MNRPLVKNPQSGFQFTVLIRKDFHVLPSSFDTACHVSIHRLPGSRRLSSHCAYMIPFGAMAPHAKNLSFGAGLPLLSTDRNFAVDHVRPPSCESQYEISSVPVMWFASV